MNQYDIAHLKRVLGRMKERNRSDSNLNGQIDHMMSKLDREGFDPKEIKNNLDTLLSSTPDSQRTQSGSMSSSSRTRARRGSREHRELRMLQRISHRMVSSSTPDCGCNTNEPSR